MQRLRLIVLILLAGIWGCGKKDKESIYTCSVDGAKCEVLINSGTDDWMPAWSPDGRKIAFVREDTDGPRICVFDVNTRTVNVVTDSFIDVDGISWSPNQSTIVVRTYAVEYGDSQATASNSSRKAMGNCVSPSCYWEHEER
jgi:Tol biopolymer transport system component